MPRAPEAPEAPAGRAVPAVPTVQPLPALPASPGDRAGHGCLSAPLRLDADVNGLNRAVLDVLGGDENGRRRPLAAATTAAMSALFTETPLSAGRMPMPR